MSFWTGTQWVPLNPPKPVVPQQRRLRDVLATVIMALVLFGIAVPFDNASGFTPQITISPGSGPPSARVLIRGTGFAPRARVEFTWDASPIGWRPVRVADDGSFSSEVVIPTAAPQAHVVAARAQSSRRNRPGLAATTTFRVEAVLTQSPTAGASPSVAPSAPMTPSNSPSPTTPTSSATPAPSPTSPASPIAVPTPVVTPAPTVPPSAPAPPATGPVAGFVYRSGLGLFLNGAPFRFTGFNIYNANSINTCAATMGVGDSLDQALREIGPGQEVIRAWFYQNLATTNGQRDWTAFDHTVAVAAARGVRIVATLADQWGSCDSGSVLPVVYKSDAWYRDGYRSEVTPGHLVAYRNWVSEVVSRYRDSPAIMAWQLMNEAEVKPSQAATNCVPDGAQVLRTWADDVSGLVRAIDPNHLISLGTIGGGQCGTQGGEYEYVHAGPNIDLCEYHDYGSPSVPMPGDVWNGLAVRVLQCANLGKPVFVGESGITVEEAGSPQQRAAWLEAKFAAQFSAGIVGELVWAWGWTGSSYDVGPLDPTVGVVSRH